MFTSIKTSKVNKDIVTDLSRKFNLGAENIIARIALTYSLSQDRKLSLVDIADSQGKEYSKNVLFGSNLPYYIGLICVKYGLYKTDKDIPKYIKLHVDDGLQLMNKELRDNPNLNGYDYLIDKIENYYEIKNNSTYDTLIKELKEYDYKGKGGDVGEATPAELMVELTAKILNV